MPSKIEIEFGISAVETVREKIKSVKTIEEAIKIIDQDLETAKLTLEYKKLDSKEINLNGDFYEDVNVKIPTNIMELLRHSQAITGDTPQQDIEYAVVEGVRARIDGGQFLPTREALVKQYNLNPVFKAILDCPVE
jgi:hypothetical protein